MVFTRAQQVYLWLSLIFVTALMLANLFGSMLFSFTLPFETPVGRAVLLSAGIIPFPLTFILTDLLNEFYGKRGAQYVTVLGFVMSILLYGLLQVLGQLPVDPASALTKPQYLHLASLYTQMFIASLSAYLVGQLLDIQIFQVFRHFTQSRYIWLRATGSTVVSQVFDSLIVSYIAFAGTLPLAKIAQLAVSNYFWKFFIVIGITPLLYLGHGILKRLLAPPRDPG